MTGMTEKIGVPLPKFAVMPSFTNWPDASDQFIKRRKYVRRNK